MRLDRGVKGRRDAVARQVSYGRVRRREPPAASSPVLAIEPNRAKMRAALARFLTARGLLPHDTTRPAAVLEAVLRFFASSDAEMLLVNREDSGSSASR